MTKKFGEVAETVADFWLGMVSAGAKGVGAAGDRIKERSKATPLYTTVAKAMAAGAATAFKQASQTADQTLRELDRKRKA